MLTSYPPRPRTRSGQRHRYSQDSSFSDRQPLTDSEATEFSLQDGLSGDPQWPCRLPPASALRPRARQHRERLRQARIKSSQAKICRKIGSGRSALLYRAPGRRQAVFGPKLETMSALRLHNSHECGFNQHPKAEVGDVQPVVLAEAFEFCARR